MKTVDRDDQSALADLANQCAQLLRAGRFDAIAKSFGYAVALGREPSSAIAADLHAALREVGASNLVRDAAPQLEIKYFKPNQDLLAVVEFTVLANNGRRLLVELVVTTRGDLTYVCLEQISSAA